MKRVGLCAILGPSVVLAQSDGRYEFEFDRLVVSPAQPSVTLTVSAAWEPDPLFAGLFGVGNYDLVASSGEFTRATVLLGQDPPNTAGMINGRRVTEAAVGQVHIPPIGIFGDPSNPLPPTEYVWTTEDFTPRTIEFITENTTNFSILTLELPINLAQQGLFTPGFATITVVPGPAGALTFGLLASFHLSRRRR